MSIKKLYIIIAVIFVGIIMLLDYLSPKEIDWTKTFDVTHKKPYGLYVFAKSLDDLFPYSYVTYTDSSLYQILRNDSYGLDSGNTYMYIRNDFELDASSFEELISWIERGNTAFISANRISNQYILDSMKFDYGFEWNLIDETKSFEKNLENLKYATMKLTNPQLEGKYEYPLAQMINYVQRFDTANAKVLGRINERINCVCYELGDGKIYFHTNPLAFTNYNMLHKNSDEYVYKLMTYLDDGHILVDQNGMRNLSHSPLRYILSEDSLRVGYFTLLAGLVIYMIFTWKRKQRAIPVVLPPRNTTVAFIKTIANLYFQKGQHRNIFDKKVRYLLEFIRRNFRMQTEKIEPEFFEQLASRSGVDQDFLVQLFAEIRSLQSQYTLTSKNVIEINKKIDRFYNEVDYDRQ
jgi:hypothetical protein